MTRRPRLTGREIIAALRKGGFDVVRVKGSHHLLRHADGRTTTIPVHSARRSDQAYSQKSCGMPVEPRRSPRLALGGTSRYSAITHGDESGCRKGRNKAVTPLYNILRQLIRLHALNEKSWIRLRHIWDTLASNVQSLCIFH